MVAHAKPEKYPRRLKLKHGKFRLGRIGMTRGAAALFKEVGHGPLPYLLRHRAGDWGCVCQEDKRANDEAVAREGDPDKQRRVVSVYRVNGTRIYIVTEWDRSVTTILLPQEY